MKDIKNLLIICVISLIIFLLDLNIFVGARRQCDFNYCNNEGECYFKGKEKACQCVDGAYKGSRCTQIQNNCEGITCKNGGTCVNLINNFYCSCQENYFGQNCSFKEVKLFKKVHLLYNRVLPVNKDSNFLLIVEDVGSVEITLELYSSSYLLEIFTFPKTGPKFFTKSNDLRSIGRKLGIRNPKDIPFTKGFYVTFKATITQLGHIPLTLLLSDYENRDLYFSHDFNIFIYKYESIQCFPRISNQKCQSPKKPLRVAIDKFNTFDPVVERSCGIDSKLEYKWSVWNHLDLKEFQIFSKDKGRIITIPPYTLWYNDKSKILRSLLTLKLEVDETSSSKKKKGKAIFRCYIFVLLNSPRAIIIGGNFREINVGKRFRIDASKSRDDNLRSNSGQQKLQFSWSCQSNVESKYCKQNMGKGAILDLPAKAFQINIKYNFTVKISTHTTTKTTNEWQEITPVIQNVLLVTIICVRNCLRRLTNTKNLLHLKADCTDCSGVGGKLTYVWKIISPQFDIGQSTQRLILDGKLLPETGKVLIQVEVFQGSRNGKASIELEINEPPKHGKCFSKQNTGVEFDTVFLIECEDYSDPNQPISYTFYANEKILARSADDILKTRLSALKDGRDLKIKVEICDCYFACTISNVDVIVTEKQIPSSSSGLSGFLKTKYGSTNLFRIVQSGDVISAMVLISMVSKQVLKMTDEDEKLQTVNTALNIIHNLDIKTEVAIQQVSLILKEMSLSVDMDYSIVVSIGRILYRISEGLIDVTRNGEIQNIQWFEYVGLTMNLIQTIERMFIEIDEFPIVHNAENFLESDDPLYENYPDYEEFDFKIIRKINDWLEGSVAVQRTFHSIGLVGSKLLEPDEPGMNLNFSAINFRIFTIDKSFSGHIKIDQWNNEIFIEPDFLSLLFKTKQNSIKLGLQIAIIQNNPFWWFPEQFKINSDIISISAFGEKIENLISDSKDDTFDKYFDIFMNINSQKDSNKTIMQGVKNDKTEIIGYVNATSDIATFGTRLSQNSFLIYEFINLNEDIRVLVKVGRKPRYWMMSKEYKVIEKSLNSPKITVLNEIGEDSNAYIGIIPHKTLSRVKINFIFKVTTYSCGSWDLSNSNWTWQHCFVGSKTTENRIHCKCNHMSMYGSKRFLTPNKLVLPREIILALSVNYTFLASIIILLIFFIIIFIWAWYKDKFDSRDIFIGSENLRNSYKYIATISTGNYSQSGTTANVTIKLNGDKGQTEEYILVSGKHKNLLQRNTIHSFTLLTTRSIGKLNSIKLSHDMSGRYPSWYCSMVRIKDVALQKEYIFLVQKWLSMIYSNTIVVNVPLSKKEELTNFKYLLREHTASFFGSWFLWQLIWSTHTRSILNRKEKVMILLTAKSIAAFIGVLYFGRTTLENVEDEREDYVRVVVTIRIFIIAIISACVSGFTLYLILFCFTKAKTKKELQYELVYEGD